MNVYCVRVCVRVCVLAAVAACSVHIIHYDRRSDDFVLHSAHNDYVSVCENDGRRKENSKKESFLFFLLFAVNNMNSISI